jgi:hypothetical protein
LVDPIGGSLFSGLQKGAQACNSLAENKGPLDNVELALPVVSINLGLCHGPTPNWSLVIEHWSLVI